MLFIFTAVRSLFIELYGEAYLTYIGPIIGPAAILFFLLVVRTVRNLTSNINLVRGILATLILGILMRVSSFFIPADELKMILGLVSSSLFIIMLSVCVYFMCVNLFIEENPIIEKLWASVCVYFMIGAIFASIYSIFLILNPSAMGVPLLNPAEVYILGMVYSTNVISGLDPVFQDTTDTIKMTAVYESIISTLFLVILIGRLLGTKS